MVGGHPKIETFTTQIRKNKKRDQHLKKQAGLAIIPVLVTPGATNTTECLRKNSDVKKAKQQLNNNREKQSMDNDNDPLTRDECVLLFAALAALMVTK